MISIQRQFAETAKSIEFCQLCTSLLDLPDILLNTCQVEVPSCFVGLVLENCQLPLENYGHVILADPSPILFYRISSTEVRCLVDIPGQKVSPVGKGGMANYLRAMVASQVSVMILHSCLSCGWSICDLSILFCPHVFN